MHKMYVVCVFFSHCISMAFISKKKQNDANKSDFHLAGHIIILSHLQPNRAGCYHFIKMLTESESTLTPTLKVNCSRNFTYPFNVCVCLFTHTVHRTTIFIMICCCVDEI